jgi:thiol oxidase
MTGKGGMLFFVTLICLLCLWNPSEARPPKQMDTLYNETCDGVVNLNYATFHNTVYSHQHSNGFLVKFYATWCGHCKAFAPKYKKLARDVLAWSPVIKLSAVNCADPLNLRLCREQKVMAYPTLKFFPPHNVNTHVPHSKNFNSEVNDSMEFILEETTTVSMRNSLVKTILEFFSSSPRGVKVPSSWPNLLPLNVSDARSLIEETDLKNKSSSNKPVLIIVEQEESNNEAKDSSVTPTVGTEVILDLSAYSDFISIHRLFHSAVTSKSLFPSLTKPGGSFEDNLPALLRVKDTLPMMVHPVDVQLLLTSASGPSMSRKAIVDYVADNFLKGVFVDPIEKLSPSLSDLEGEEDDEEESSTEAGVLPNGFTNKVHMIDLYNALRYSFYHEVLLHQSFNQSQVRSLQKYFVVLNKFFPFDNENPRRFIRRMTQWIHARNQTTSSALQAIMKAGSEGFLFPLRNYITCRGSRSELRGYPCSLWLLFHTLTVSEYEYFRTQSKKDSNFHGTHLVLPAMKEYISHFFTCKDCSDHFAQMAQGLEQDLVHDNSSVLWLWRKHNEVNGRLAGRQESEDPLFPKTQYPPIDVCPDCNIGGNLDAIALDQGSPSDHKTTVLSSSLQFNETRVLNFLVSRYQKASLIKKGITSSTMTTFSGDKIMTMMTTCLLINLSLISNFLF